MSTMTLLFLLLVVVSSAFSPAGTTFCRPQAFVVTTTTTTPTTTTTTRQRQPWHLGSSPSPMNDNKEKNDMDAESSGNEASSLQQEEDESEQEQEQEEQKAPPPQERASFDQAGASLMEEEDRKRMEEMGDFDSNPAYRDDSMEQMRAAIRERTAAMGLEKSKVSADYIQSRAAAARSAGSAAAARESSSDKNNMFGGLDLSKITSDAKSRGEWDEDMPTMFYEPESEMSVEEQEKVDPLMTKNPIEQAWKELSMAKWPDLASAGREVVLMAAVVAFSAVLIIGADKVLRTLYTDWGFIPSAQELANYASRFDGLDLPTGWTDNMNENDVAEFADKVNTVVTPSIGGGGTTSGLPEL